MLTRFAMLMRGKIEPDHAADVEIAASLAEQQQGLSARDLLHAAVMRRTGVARIVSADRGFEHLPGLQRLDPADVTIWIGQVR